MVVLVFIYSEGVVLSTLVLSLKALSDAYIPVIRAIEWSKNYYLEDELKSYYWIYLWFFGIVHSQQGLCKEV